MAKSWRSTSPLLPLLVAVLLVFAFAPPSLAKKKPSPRPITDTEIREKKNACYADIESGMWGSKCKASMIDKENCALQCLSSECYDLVYGGDPVLVHNIKPNLWLVPESGGYCTVNTFVNCFGTYQLKLEEGEKDYIRSQEYKYCMHKSSLGESLEGVKGAFDY